MRFSNLHTHTTFSDGKNTVAENVEAAIEKNMLSIGFSDHSFTAIDPSYCMHTEHYSEYRNAVLAAKEKYKGIIPIFLGMEMDLFSDVPDGEFDYFIASVHYIIKGDACYAIDHTVGHQEKCVRDVFSGDKLEMAKHYFELMQENVMRLRPQIVGHFDVLNKFSYMPEEDERFVDIAEAAMRECFKWCPRFEVNTGAIARGYRKLPYPNMHLLKLLSELGGEVVLNSDSHKAENLDCFFSESVDIIRNAGFREIAYLDVGGFRKMSI